MKAAIVVLADTESLDCDRTCRLLTDPGGPYAGRIIGIEPESAVPPERAGSFDCDAGALRPPKQTKGATGVSRSLDQADDGDCCDDQGGCC